MDEERYIKLLANFLKNESWKEEWKLPKSMRNKFNNTSQKSLDGSAVEKAAILKLMKEGKRA